MITKQKNSTIKKKFKILRFTKDHENAEPAVALLKETLNLENHQRPLIAMCAIIVFWGLIITALS